MGNPGDAYIDTPHNAGFICLDQLENKMAGHYLHTGTLRMKMGKIDCHDALLARPLTYMNRSGEAVQELRERFPVTLDQFVLIYDDADLPLGQIRVRAKGRAGSHRGVQSVTSALQTIEFPRIRIGIQNELKNAMGMIQYVLEPLKKDMFALLTGGILKAVDAALLIMEKDIHQAMNVFNRKVNPLLPAMEAE